MADCGIHGRLKYWPRGPRAWAPALERTAWRLCLAFRQGRQSLRPACSEAGASEQETVFLAAHKKLLTLVRLPANRQGTR